MHQRLVACLQDEVTTLAVTVKIQLNAFGLLLRVATRTKGH